VPIIKEKLKQQIQAKAQRIKRFGKRNKHFWQNKIFKEDSKKFYRELGKKKVDVDEPWQPEEVVDFWSNIWEKEKSHNKDSAWIKGQEDLHKDLKAQSWTVAVTGNHLERIKFLISGSNILSAYMKT